MKRLRSWSNLRDALMRSRTSTLQQAAKARKARARRARRRRSGFKIITPRNGWITLLVCVALLVPLLAVTVLQRSQGNTVRAVPPDAGTVWVSSDRNGLFGRVNKPAGSLDTALEAPDADGEGAQLDVVQAGGSIVARDRGTGRIYPVDDTTGQLITDKAVNVDSANPLEVGGGSVASLDPVTGRLWVGRSGSESLDVAPLQSTLKPRVVVPLATNRAADETSSAVAISQSGTVVAVGTRGDLRTLSPSDSSATFDVRRASLGRALREAQVTMVGEEPVVLDAPSGDLYVADQRFELPGDTEGMLLQQSGPEATFVTIAGPERILRVGLESGDVTEQGVSSGGDPTRPVVAGDCVYAVWGGTPGTALRACGPNADFSPVELAGEPDVQTPDIRVNLRSAVLNDLGTGGVWDLDTGARLDNWSAIKPPKKKQRQRDKRNDNPTPQEARKPRAVDDRMAARAGTASILHVLDNDSNPSGSILSIVDITKPSDSSVRAVITPDGQAVQVDLPPGASSFSFDYTIDNGEDRSSARVSVRINGPSTNGAPALRANYERPALNVAVGGRLSVPVIGDWRDPDSDMLALGESRAEAGEVASTNDGRIAFSAPLKPGPVRISYQVSDGRRPTKAALSINVLPNSSAILRPADAQPDVARGSVGKPIVVRPLDNDGPGVDTTEPNAQLAIAGSVVAPEGVQAVTDRAKGTVTVTASVPGTYQMTYAAAYGNAPRARGQIRIDVAPSARRECQATVDTAVVVGQNASIVDVLSNDLDPSGRVLTVQSATADDTGDIEAAVIRGQWVRVRALAPNLGNETRSVQYTITNGVCPAARGTISIQQVPPTNEAVPYTVDDQAVVRAGDSVAIPVLDNDVDPGGSPLGLAASVSDAPAPGRLLVTSPDGETGSGADLGRAYVSGRVVRYQAPARVQSQRTVKISYVAENLSSARATGFAYVKINPAPSQANPNQPPAPPTLEARVVAGDTTTIQIPSTGVDPDGDSVTSLGPESSPLLGRILASGPSTIVYEAYPTSSNTDELTYTVADRYGKLGTGRIRISVVQPGDPQPIVATDDYITAAPGKTVKVPVLDNDIVPIGDEPQLDALGVVNQGNPDARGARLDPDAGLLRATVPEGPRPAQVRYSVRGALGEPANASVIIRPERGYNAPPVARNAFAAPKPGATEVVVDAAANVTDPDGSDDQITITRVFGDPEATISGGNVTVPVRELPQILGYEATDGDGATAFGVIYVPTSDNGTPYAKPDQLIRMKQNGTTELDVSDYVIDPAGKQVRLTNARLYASPPGNLQVTADGATGLRLKASNDYVGPAAIAFQVTNGTSATDPDGQLGFIIVPVQIGPEVPVLRCPTSPIVLAQGGGPRDLDIPALCHVWYPPSLDPDEVEFTGRFPSGSPGLSVRNDGPRVLRLTAGGEARTDSSTDLEVRAAGTKAVPGNLRIEVTPAGAPRLDAIPLTSVKAGDAATFDIRNYARSQLGDPQFSVVNARQVSGEASQLTRVSDTTFAITPDRESAGRIVYEVTITDVADQNLRSRHATGLVVLNVLGVPEAPGAPVQVGGIQNKQITIGWAAPRNNGMPITTNIVEWPGGSQRCSASPCTIRGLENGVPYRFTVKAVNGVGEGKPSPQSGPMKADTTPGAPGAPTTSQPRDGSLTVSWRNAPNEGSPITKYLVTWPGGQQETAGTSIVAGGLDNNTPTTFTIKAYNEAGWGPAVTVTGQSAGRPQAPNVTDVQSVPRADDQLTATIVWNGVGANGPDPVLYTLYRDGQPLGNCRDISGTSCTDTVPGDGARHTYAVLARNPVFDSGVGPQREFIARAKPDQASEITIAPTGDSETVEVSFVVPKFRSGSASIQCVIEETGGSCGGRSYLSFAEGRRETYRAQVPGTNGANIRARIVVTNNEGESSQSTSAPSATVYGPVVPAQISNAVGTAQTAEFDFTIDPRGLPVQYEIQFDNGELVCRNGNTGTWAPGTGTQRCVVDLPAAYRAGYNLDVTIRVRRDAQDGIRGSGPERADARISFSPPPPQG